MISGQDARTTRNFWIFFYLEVPKTISVPHIRSHGEVWTIVKGFEICDRAASRKEGSWLKKLTLTKS
ncbi:MAG: hypothetical protein ACYTXY_46910 [Nostoc sp.]